MVRLVKKEFVAVTMDSRNRKFKDAEGEFVLASKCVGDWSDACGDLQVVTASGKRLERGELHPDKKTFQLSLERALKGWAALPAAERKPGAVQVGEPGPLDPQRAAMVPPDKCLIVKVHNRQLGLDAKGDFRYTRADDYIPIIREKFPVSMWAARFAEAAQDRMWVTQAEWRAMMPAAPRKGQRVPVPTALCERIFRFHLDPARGYGESNNFHHATANDGALRLTVEEVTSSEVRLRLDGTADLRNDKQYGGKKVAYQPRLLGYLAYDPAKKVFTRFDVVALGTMSGSPVGENYMGERVGAAQPLGIAFELVAKPAPADFLSPRGLRNDGGQYDRAPYLGSAK